MLAAQSGTSGVIYAVEKMGTSHEKVKKALPNNEVIGSSADEAVAHYLENLLLK